MGRDVVSTMNDQMSEVLADDEQVVGAQALTVKGSRALATWAERVDADLASLLPTYLAHHGDVDELVVADDTIPNAFLAAVTGERVLVFSRSLMGKPKELVEEFSLAETTLDYVDSGDRVKSRVFLFGTPAGKVFAGECPINGKALGAADEFIAAWAAAGGLSAN